mgnify:FL=1
MDWNGNVMWWHRTVLLYSYNKQDRLIPQTYKVLVRLTVIYTEMVRTTTDDDY